VALAVALCASAAGSMDAAAQTSGTRTSSFAYNATSGLLTQEVIEPNQGAYRLQTDYGYDAFGNKTQVTVSGVDIATRSATVTFDARGQFPASASNALSQSESWQYDARFGQPTSHTGPNGLTTTWTYDTFGRKTLEVRADGTRTTWSYLYCSGINGGTAPCPAGGTYLVRMTPLAADGTTQIGPIGTTYFDQLDRAIASDTQGFDGSAIRSATQYDALGRVAQKSRPYFVTGGTQKWTTFTYDTLGRVLTQTAPDSSVQTNTYNGLVTSQTNALSQTRTTTKNSQGQIVSVLDAASNTTTYVYDAFGNMVQVTDAVGNVTTNTYDPRGRKVASSDPDMGSWSYTYDVLDKLKTQTDAKSQTTTLTYDLLGRTTQRVAPDQTATWVYDTATNGIGKLASASTDSGYARSHSYDALGRASQVTYTINGINHNIGTGYDAASRINAVTYPTGFAVAYTYNAYGYQAQLTNAATSQALWTADARDAELHLTRQTAGNGVVTVQDFDADTGRLSNIEAGTAGAVQSFAYTYDLLGQLLTRSDANTSMGETFTYDTRNRLTSSTVALSPTPLVKNFTYDAVGRLTSKSDVGTYTYPAPGSPRPHAVSSIAGVITASFSYDANGNMSSGNGLTVSYTSSNKPTSITRGTVTIGFDHDPEQQRYRQTGPSSTTLYLNGGGVLAERVSGTGGSEQWNHYLVAAGGMVGLHIERSDETTATRYFHKDHLGSIATLTDETGAVVERLSYDAWGKRRFANGSDDPAGSIASQTTRGFTEHEMLADVGLIHMNGRVYDPLLARFGTPDPMTENPFSTQGWNRYSYVGNSPLNFTDPSGYCFLGCFWKPIFKAIGRVLRQLAGSILRIAVMAACAFAPGCQPFLPLVAGLTSAIVVGISGGKLGDALKAGFIAMATAVAFNIVGDLTGGFDGITPKGLKFGSEAHMFNVAGHAAVGCASAVASGDKCGPGALAGAVGSFAGPLIGGPGGFSAEKLVAKSILGGVAAVAGGGKFENGAVTAAFGYLFNEVLHFDGSKATLKDDDGQVLGEYPATSGKAGVTDAGLPWSGPIPEGTYRLDPSEISEAKGVWYWMRNLLGDWGTYRVQLHPTEGTNTYGRSGFFLHGGQKPGSAGCIDVGICDIDLFSYLKGLRTPVSVHVKYPQSGPPNWSGKK
jgi:RHS repeat-associated protein